MAIRVQCPKCSATHELPDEQAGGTAQCSCGELMSVPAFVPRPPPPRSVVLPVMIVFAALVVMGSLALTGLVVLRSGLLPKSGPKSSPAPPSPVGAPMLKGGPEGVAEPVSLAGGQYDGTWSGECSSGGPVKFTIKAGRMKTFHIEYRAGGTVSVTTDIDYTGRKDTGLPISSDGTFGEGSSESGVTGTFRSDTEAEGTYHSEDDTTGAINLTWTARRQ